MAVLRACMHACMLLQRVGPRSHRPSRLHGPSTMFWMRYPSWHSMAWHACMWHAHTRWPMRRITLPAPRSATHPPCMAWPCMVLHGMQRHHVLPWSLVTGHWSLVLGPWPCMQRHHVLPQQPQHHGLCGRVAAHHPRGRPVLGPERVHRPRARGLGPHRQGAPCAPVRKGRA